MFKPPIKSKFKKIHLFQSNVGIKIYILMPCYSNRANNINIKKLILNKYISLSILKKYKSKNLLFNESAIMPKTKKPLKQEWVKGKVIRSLV